MIINLLDDHDVPVSNIAKSEAVNSVVILHSLEVIEVIPPLVEQGFIDEAEPGSYLYTLFVYKNNQYMYEISIEDT